MFKEDIKRLGILSICSFITLYITFYKESFVSLLWVQLSLLIFLFIPGWIITNKIDEPFFVRILIGSFISAICVSALTYFSSLLGWKISIFQSIFWIIIICLISINFKKQRRNPGKNILHITNEVVDSYHGGSTHITMVEKGLIKLGYNIIRVAPGKTKEILLLDNIKIFTFPVDPRWFRYRLPVLFFFHLFKICRNENIDIIIERYTPLGGAGILFGKLKGIPTIMEVNSPGIELEYSAKKIGLTSYKILYLYRKLLMHFTNGIKTDSYNAILDKCFHWKSIDIPYGAIASINRKNDNDTINIVFISAYQFWHGAETIVEAANELCKRIRNIRFIMVGDGSKKEVVKANVKMYNLDKNFDFLEKVPPEHIPELLSKCDIAIAPFDLSSWEDAINKYEFFFRPIKIYEYMAAGLPIITVNTPSLKKMLDDAAIYIPTKNNEQELIGALESLITDKKLRASLGDKAKERLNKNKWTWDDHVNKFEKFISEVTK